MPISFIYVSGRETAFLSSFMSFMNFIFLRCLYRLERQVCTISRPKEGTVRLRISYLHGFTTSNLAMENRSLRRSTLVAVHYQPTQRCNVQHHTSTIDLLGHATSALSARSNKTGLGSSSSPCARFLKSSPPSLLCLSC